MIGDSAPTVPTILLALTSLTAGFLAASAPQEDQTLRAQATLHPGGEAFQVTAGAGETIALGLAEPGPPADVAVFGPDDELRDRVSVGDGEARVSIPRSGDWVLVPLAEAAALDLRLESTGGDMVPAEVTSIPVREHTRSLADQSEGRLDVDRSLLVDRRPAVAFLRAEGHGSNLSTRLATAQGPIYEADTETLNGTLDLDQLGDEASVTPRHIEPGLLAVQAQAEAFDGTLDLVHRSYDRTPDRGPEVNRSMEGLPEMGVPVATLEAGTAAHVPAEDLTRLRFAVPGDASAEVRVYNADHSVRGDFTVESQARYDWDFPREEPSIAQRTVSLGTDDRYTVWVGSVADTDAVHVLAPGVRAASPGQLAPIAETTLDLSGGAAATGGPPDEAEYELDGGLVAVGVNVDAAAAERVEASVTGPLGNVYLYEEQFHANGASIQSSEQTNPRDYTNGTHTVAVEVSNAAEANVEVTLTSYRTP